jgi:hypothetical protein
MAVEAPARQRGEQVAWPHAARVGRAAQGANVVGAQDFGLRQQRPQARQVFSDR